MSYVAEKEVIACLISDIESIDGIYNILQPDMFTSYLLGKMYNEFQAARDNGYTISLPMFKQKLLDTGATPFVVDDLIDEIVETFKNSIGSIKLKSNANVIINDYKSKKFKEIVNFANTSPVSIEENIGDVINQLEALVTNKEFNTSTLSEITEKYSGCYFKEDVEKKRLNVGFSNIDDLLGGLEGGDVTIIGARPAVGKSAFVTQITSNLAKDNKRIGFYNLEMKEKQVYERFVVSESGIGLTRLRRAKKFLGDEEERFKAANNRLRERKNIIITTGSKTVSEIRNESRHMNYDIIIIDYLQLLKADKTYRGNRYAEVGSISKAIKEIAMELNIPIIVLSQLNRVSEAKETKEPTMAELRESGDIEQDASVIMLLWNLTEDRKKKGRKIEKNRQGTTGKVVLEFNGDLMQFKETGEDVNSKKWQPIDDDCPFK